MANSAAPSHLTAHQRARRATRGGASRSVPVPLLVPALIAMGFLVLPLAGLLIRAPWGRIGAALSGSDATQALVLSLWTATASTAISLAIGVPLAWVLARSRIPGRALVRALVLLPMVLPPVVGGVALLFADPAHRFRFAARGVREPTPTDADLGLPAPIGPLDDRSRLPWSHSGCQCCTPPCWSGRRVCLPVRRPGTCG